MKAKHAILAAVVLCAASVAAQDLKLIPYPKQVQRGEGQVTVTADTRIVLNPAHARQDRVAADMLAADIEAATGRKPRISTGHGGAIYLTRLEAKASDDPLFQAEGYTIEAAKGKITVAGASDAGLFYGVQTLRQLLLPDGKRLAVPAVTIRDWPTMRWRGYQADLSRGPIAKLDFLKKQVRILSEYKINMFSPYMEAVYAYPGHPLAAPQEAALTPDDARELVRYAAQYYVTVVPEQEAFGHLHNILKYDAYSNLAETPHGHVLAPVQEGSYALIKDMFDDLAKSFTGPFLHIGADETFELGRGQTKELADKEGIGKVYLDFLSRISAILKPLNKRIMFWGDIAVHYPDLLGILPKDVIAVPWSYGARPDFTSMLQPYKNAGLDMIVAPGVNNWNVIFPNLDVAYVNIANFVRDGQKFGAMGMLNTEWNDSGESLMEFSWAPYVFGAACSWQQGCSADQFSQSFDWAFYRNTDNTFTTAILNLNKSNTLMKSAGLNQAADSYTWLDPFTPAGAQFTAKALPIARDLRLSAEDALRSLMLHRSQARLHADTIDALILSGWRLDLLGMKVEFADEMNTAYWDAYMNLGDRARVGRDLGLITGTNGHLEDLREATLRVRDMYTTEYLKENHPYWLDSVRVRYDNLADLWQQKILQIRNARTQFPSERLLPPPAEMGFVQPPPPPAPPARRPQ
jgi:hexosaminidase